MTKPITLIQIKDINSELQYLIQVSQVLYADNRVLTIDYHTERSCPVVTESGLCFFADSSATIRQIIEEFGYIHNNIEITWIDTNGITRPSDNEVLDINISRVPLNQISVYPIIYQLDNYFIDIDNSSVSTPTYYNRDRSDSE